ncbi:MAG: hypothetical protein Q7J31_04460 [Syntrophales bacterium]|nr:hypothetical protein [Syntrophales bacterium]
MKTSKHKMFIIYFSLLALLFVGCSSSSKSIKAVPPPPPTTAENDARRQEQINRGLALFEGGHFADAAGSFEKAAALTGGQAPITRKCLMAAAVSRLVINDRDGFTGNMIKIRNQYERSDFLLLTDSDVKLKHLMDLYERMTKGGKK